MTDRKPIEFVISPDENYRDTGDRIRDFFADYLTNLVRQQALPVRLISEDNYAAMRENPNDAVYFVKTTARIDLGFIPSHLQELADSIATAWEAAWVFGGNDRYPRQTTNGIMQEIINLICLPALAQEG